MWSYVYNIVRVYATGIVKPASAGEVSGNRRTVSILPINGSSPEEGRVSQNSPKVG